MVDGVTHICQNCQNSFEGRFCNQCGEKVYTSHDRSLKHIFEEFAHFVSHFDNKLFISLRTIFFRPGQLSLDYCAGKRIRYYPPVSLFLIMVVLYLLFPIFKGLNMPLEIYNDSWGRHAKELISSKMKKENLSFQQLSAKYEKTSEKVAKILLFLTIPMSALPLYLVFFRKRKYYFDSVIFSAELNTVFLLTTFFIFPVVLFIIFRILKLVGHPILRTNDIVVSAISYALISGLFFPAAIRRFYHLSRPIAIVSYLYFAFFHILIIFWLYKYLLFVISMALT